ncbi:MAG: response regulator transcription factor [Verrucomicrobiota bacterium]
MKKTRVLLTDDHPVYRDGLRMMLESDGDLEVVAAASSGRETAETAARVKPDVVLLDINLPDASGIDVAKALRDSPLTCAIMFVTMEKSVAILKQAVELNIDGYLHKNSEAEEIIGAVKAVAAGEKYFSPAVAELLLTMVKKDSGTASSEPGLTDLTPAERKVLRLVASDRTSKQIASDLGIGVRTVESHRARITRKLGLSGAHSLVKFAFEHRDRL